MKTPRHFEKVSTSAALLALGAGFVSLGALSFIKRHLEDAESGLLLNSAYPIVGGLISILLGITFFAIALRFMAARLKEEKAFRKVSRARDPQLSMILRAGAGRAKLRLSRGFPGCLVCDVIPQKSNVRAGYGT
jgi:hypothetical protein